MVAQCCSSSFPKQSPFEMTSHVLVRTVCWQDASGMGMLVDHRMLRLSLRCFPCSREMELFFSHKNTGISCSILSAGKERLMHTSCWGLSCPWYVAFQRKAWFKCSIGRTAVRSCGELEDDLCLCDIEKYSAQLFWKKYLNAFPAKTG